MQLAWDQRSALLLNHCRPLMVQQPPDRDRMINVTEQDQLLASLGQQ
jgi:hypothetical protein